MKYSTFFPKSVKREFKDDLSTNAVLLAKAGYIDQLMAGSYTLLPLGFKVVEKIKNIIPGLPKIVTVTGWAFTTVSSPNLAIILDVSENDKPYDWMAFPLTDKLTETGKWVEFNATFYFNKPMNSEQQIKIYPWNQSKKAVYIDDLKIKFEY